MTVCRTCFKILKESQKKCKYCYQAFYSRRQFGYTDLIPVRKLNDTIDKRFFQIDIWKNSTTEKNSKDYKYTLGRVRKILKLKW